MIGRIDYAGKSLYFKGRRTVVELYFRRLQAFEQQHQLAKYEIGFDVQGIGYPPLDGESVKSVVQACLALPVAIPPQAQTCPLVQAGPRIACALASGTTYRRSIKPQEWVVCDCTRTVLVEHGSFEVTGFDGARRMQIDDTGALQLAVETAKLKELTIAKRIAKKVAISYAHKDTSLMKSFATHIDAAVRDGMIEQWDDRWIIAGTAWRQEIDKRFRDADVIVLLLSPSF